MVRLNFRLPGGRINEVAVTGVLHVEGPHNLLCQSQLWRRGICIEPVNGYGIDLYAPSPGRALAATAPEEDGLFPVDMVLDSSSEGSETSMVAHGHRGAGERLELWYRRLAHLE